MLQTEGTLIQGHPNLPKYVNLAEHLKEQIRSGALKPGDRLPSFGEVRERFGVSQHTVEKTHALLEKDLLIEREQGRGVFVAQPQRRAGTNVIAFFGLEEPRTRDPYWGRVLRGVQSGARELGLEVLILNSMNPALGWKHIEGVLVMGSAIDWTVDQLPADMPCVTVLKPPERRLRPSVVADDYGGAKSAAEHLISLGHRRIGYLISGYDARDRIYDPVSKQRLEGYRDALLKAGILPDAGWVRHFQPYTRERGVFAGAAQDSIKEWLDNGWADIGCTAILAHNDETAIGVIRALNDANIQVPEQVSVVGFDGTELGRLFTPQLTTVKVPLEEIGHEGTKILWRLVQEQSIQRGTITLPTELVVRESTASPAVTDHAVVADDI